MKKWYHVVNGLRNTFDESKADNEKQLRNLQSILNVWIKATKFHDWYIHFNKIQPNKESAYIIDSKSDLTLVLEFTLHEKEWSQEILTKKINSTLKWTLIDEVRLSKLLDWYYWSNEDGQMNYYLSNGYRENSLLDYNNEDPSAWWWYLITADISQERITKVLFKTEDTAIEEELMELLHKYHITWEKLR